MSAMVLDARDASNNLLALQVSPWELQVWSTPVGMLAEEVGQGSAFKAEIVADKNVRKVPTFPPLVSVTNIGKRWQAGNVLTMLVSHAGARSVEERLWQR